MTRGNYDPYWNAPSARLLLCPGIFGLVAGAETTVTAARSLAVHFAFSEAAIGSNVLHITLIQRSPRACIQVPLAVYGFLDLVWMAPLTVVACLIACLRRGCWGGSRGLSLPLFQWGASSRRWTSRAT